MKYVGSKRRLAKHLYEVMAPYRQDRLWVEPFVGGANMLSYVKGRRLGADKDIFAIEALKLIRDNPHSLPKDMSELSVEQYKAIRDSKYPIGIAGYVGYSCSFAAKFFGGYPSPNPWHSDYIREAYNSAVKQSPTLQGVDLICCDFSELVLDEPCLIYCDPPYANTLGYREKFDRESFWLWAYEKVREGHEVFVSEYEVPSYAPCVKVYQRVIHNNVNKLEDNSYKPAYECLYRVIC